MAHEQTIEDALRAHGYSEEERRRILGPQSRPVRPAVAPEDVSIHPWPEPLALDEPKHRAENVVYQSFLRAKPQIPGAHAYYSVTLPFTATKRRECDFLVVAPGGIAIIEVKGGYIDVDSVAGQGVYWRQARLDGTPVDKAVSAAQIFTTTQVLQEAMRDEAGVEVPNFAQIFVFPDTPRSIVRDPRVLEMNDSPHRDFPRIVFKDELEKFGIWSIVAHELSLPGRATAIPADLRAALADWAEDNTRVEARSDEPFDPLGRTASVPRFEPPRAPPVQPLAHRPGVAVPKDWAPLIVDAKPAPARRKRGWRLALLAGIGLAVLLVWALGGHAPPARQAASPPIVPVPERAAPPAPAAGKAANGNTVEGMPSTVPPHLNPSPVPAPARLAAAVDPIASALAKAVAMPVETRVDAAGGDWVRFLGPVQGRPGCHMVEIGRAGRSDMRVACVRTDGNWSY